MNFENQIKNEIFLQDCFEYFKLLDDNSVDLILTDPPYGIKYSNINPNIKRKRAKSSIIGDAPEDINWDLLLKEMYRVLKPGKFCFIFCRLDMIMRIGQNILNSDFKYCHGFIWRKGDMNFGNLNLMGTIHELGIVISKGQSEKIRPLLIDDQIKNRYKAEYSEKISGPEMYEHPTQKPVALLSFLISAFTDENDLIFDPFSGVGSTTVAAKITNRNSIATELDPIFYNLSLERLSNYNHLEFCRNRISSGLTYLKGGHLSHKEKKFKLF